MNDPITALEYFELFDFHVTQVAFCKGWRHFLHQDYIRYSYDTLIAAGAAQGSLDFYMKLDAHATYLVEKGVLDSVEDPVKFQPIPQNPDGTLPDIVERAIEPLRTRSKKLEKIYQQLLQGGGKGFKFLKDNNVGELIFALMVDALVLVAYFNPDNIPGGPTPPVNMSLPKLSGSAIVGSTLTVDPGTWFADPEPTLSFAWLNFSDRTVLGTGETYTTTEADIGIGILCQVTATNPAGSASADTIPIGPIYQPS